MKKDNLFSQINKKVVSRFNNILGIIEEVHIFSLLITIFGRL